MNYQITPASVRRALVSILDYWMEHTVDGNGGGFYGRISEGGVVDTMAPKGSVLNARILWTFSAAYRVLPDPAYLQMAERSFSYFSRYFPDPVHGGVYWTVNAAGEPLDTKKQVYALAFAIYGLSEYYAATGEPRALDLAVRLFEDVEEHSFDPEKGGYFEAFARDWSSMQDLRLSARDANEKKSMNTHLHVLEAYSNLYRVWRSERLLGRIDRLLENFSDFIIDAKTHHLVLFFDEQWTPRSDTVSFGHDIEASWLLLEAAELVADGSPANVAPWKERSVTLALAASEGIAPDGSLYYERGAGGDWSRERHWWVQAEALVGFHNAWELTADPIWYTRLTKNWHYIGAHLVDRLHGEWFWGIRDDRTPMPGQDKVGVWKCPYHNSRAMMEILRRMERTNTHA